MNSDIMRLLTGRSRCKLIAGAMTLVLAAFTAPQIVLSNTESCRAQLDVRPSGGGRYALIAYSAIPGTLSGYLFFDTKAGWYRAVLNGV